MSNDLYDSEFTIKQDDNSNTKKVKLDLEIDTSVTDISKNPYNKIIHLAEAVDSWRVWPRIFLTVYVILLYRVVDWFMQLSAPTMEQSGLVSVVVGAGAAWFGLYIGTDKKRKDD